ncbi:MAG: ribonuclease HIII [Chlamydiae bacterium CG10_big_fil_rev_8_21_14_0_10_42_34]|nr:MAG: ribonuclease HIII [Chlamydiae bacterium CG10_big_fil_rev_8_21_14_0_10_42_34]
MTFTTKIDTKLADKLREDLTEQGFELTKPPYTIFSAKKQGVSCTLYESGTLTVQGKQMKPFMEFYLEPEILKTFHYSHPEAHLDLTPHIGMDEAGKGDFFGPLCIAAVYADGEGIKKMLEIGVKDSKRISDEGILKIAKKIKDLFPFTVIRLFPLKYNELHAKFKNLNRLLAWAHASALGDLSAKTGCKEALLDQFAEKHVVENALKQKKIELNLQQKVRGEEDLVVAAASILARAAFLEGMNSLSEEYDMTLPKGASSQVIVAGQKFIAKFGRESLGKVAKTHFKTANEL